MLDPPTGLHRDDALHEGETARQWLAACDARMARKKIEYSIGARHAVEKARAQSEPSLPFYSPAAVVEDLAALDPDFDKSDQYDRIMSWFGNDTCCPGFSYLPVGYCPVHGG